MRRRPVPVGRMCEIHHPFVTQVFGTTTYNHFLPIPINVTDVKHTRLGADGQTGGGCPGATTGTSNERTFIGGPILNQLRGTPGRVQYQSPNDCNIPVAHVLTYQ